MPSICDIKPGETALDGLNGVADVTQTAMNTQQQPDPITIVCPPKPDDYAVGWVKKGPQEPAFWPPYPEAVAFLSAFEKSSAVRRVRATAMMDAYYTLDMRDLPKSDLDARNVRGNLEDQQKAVTAMSAAYNAGTLSFSAFQKSALEVAQELAYISRYLNNLDASMAKVPCIKRCSDMCEEIIAVLTNLKGPLTVNTAVQIVVEVVTNLNTVLAALTSITTGYSVITNNESIPNFFLMRLLVAYKINPVQSATNSYASIASSQLTALLHNKQQWLFDIMQRMIADLAKMLGSDEDVAFYLKGGRGLSYLLKKPEEGENDWDTQILINPHLPYDKWWNTYYAVQNAVNNRLTRYDFVFSANLMTNAPSLITATNAAKAALANDSKVSDGIFDAAMSLAIQASLDDQEFAQDEDMVLENEWQQATRKLSGNCKAELIDVGVPRVCTIELLEQWEHVRGGITSSAQGIPFPGAPYFIDEFIGMIRECDAGVSPSPTKRPKRLKRLLNVLSPEVSGFTAFRDAQSAVSATAQLNTSLAKIAQIASAQISALATIMLGQFCTAYELTADPNLAQNFDGLAADALDTAAINALMSMDSQADFIFKWCHTISKTMTTHLALRGKTLSDHGPDITDLVAQTVQGKKISPVIEGSFAICLHQQMNNGDTRNKVAPAEFAAISLYYPDCASDGDITEDMFQEVVTKVLAIEIPYFGTVSANFQTRTIKVFAKQSIALQSGSYAPLVVEFTLKSMPIGLNTAIGPQGTLLLALQPLTVWCRGWAAGVSEWATRLQLTETYGALIEMAALNKAVL